MKRIKRLIVIMASILIVIGCNQKERLREIRKVEHVSLMDTWEKSVEQAPDLANMQKATILGVDIQENNQSIFQVNYNPQAYKAMFDSWSIFYPYKNEAVTDTEALYELIHRIQSAPLKESNKKIDQLHEMKSSISIAYNDSSQENPVPNQFLQLALFEDATGEKYVNIVGTDLVYEIPSTLVDELFHIQPFDYVLKIPTLVQMENVAHIYMHSDDKELMLSKKDDQWYIHDEKLSDQIITDIYTQLLSVSVVEEFSETDTEKNEQAEVSIVFYRTDDHPDVEINYYSFDDEYVRASVNGISNFLVNQKDILAIVERIKQYNK